MEYATVLKCAILFNTLMALYENVKMWIKKCWNYKEM